MQLPSAEKEKLLAPFFERLDKIQLMEPALKTELVKLFTLEQKAKEELLLKEGDICKHIWAVLQGSTRAFHFVEGVDITSRIIMPSHIIISVGSFYTQTPALENIETIEPSVLAYLTRSQLEKLYVQFPSLNFIVRKITEYYFYMSEKRLYMLRKQKALDKYKFFLEHYPGLINEIPLKYVASFLGMNQETLSRARKKMMDA